MNQLDRIEKKLDQILEHLGQTPTVTSGAQRTPDGLFSPGSGTIGAANPHAGCHRCDGHGWIDHGPGVIACPGPIRPATQDPR